MPINPTQPVDEQPNPYLPQGPQPLICDQFMGINTDPGRAGVQDEQLYWSDSFFPIAPRKAQTMYGIGSALYTPGGGRTIIFFAFYNIGSTPYMVAFLDDGSAVQVNTSTSATTTILPASTLIGPTIANVGTSQWGNQYLIIVADQLNGYWLWNGSTLFTSGGLAPIVTITNVGSAYKTVPAVIISGGHGTGASITAAIANGRVTGATVTSPGTGYLATDTVSLTFTGGNSGGTGGSLNAIMSGGTGGTGASVVAIMAALGEGAYKVNSVSVVAGGSGYSNFAVITPSGGVVSISPAFHANVTGGAITSVTVTVPGQYESAAVPTLTVTDAGLFVVSSITVIAAGSGYSSSATITFTGGGSVVSQAAGQLNLNAGGSITSVSVTSPGGYGSSVAPTLGISDTAVTATGTVGLMPFAIQGTAVETYQGRVWVANGATIFYSAPGAFGNFASAAGGGNFTSNDSFLKVGYIQLINANGFLWLIGDSSVNYISNVQTSASFVTTFTNSNADPEVGSPYPASVETFGRDILLANSIGVYVVNGGAAQKISDPLDGVWNSVSNFGSLSLSSSKANIFGNKTWIVLAKILDPVSGSSVNKLFCFYNKKWFPATQDVTLIFIKHQEINSVITAYGTDGTSVYPLFNTASAAIQKIFQTKLWDTPGGFLLTKAATRWWGLTLYNSTVTPNMIVSIDSEANAQPYSTPTSTYTITGPTAVGYFSTPPQAIGQQGVLTGWTFKTNAADMVVVATMMDDQVVGYRG